MPGETEMSGSAMAHVPDHSGRTGEGRWNRSLPMHMIGRPCWGSDGETAMSVPGIGPRFRTPRVRAIALGFVALAELAIALPFLFVSPSTVRGVPGQLLVLLG